MLTCHVNLTLTRVVFELDRKQNDKTLMVYLTLTRVVFEFNINKI